MNVQFITISRCGSRIRHICLASAAEWSSEVTGHTTKRREHYISTGYMHFHFWQFWSGGFHIFTAWLFYHMDACETNK